jgi:hypothetical protein
MVWLVRTSPSVWNRSLYESQISVVASIWAWNRHFTLKPNTSYVGNFFCVYANVTALNAATEGMVCPLCTLLVRVSFVSPQVGYPNWGLLCFVPKASFRVLFCISFGAVYNTQLQEHNYMKWEAKCAREVVKCCSCGFHSSGLLRSVTTWKSQDLICTSPEAWNLLEVIYLTALFSETVVVISIMAIIRIPTSHMFLTNHLGQ